MAATAFDTDPLYLLRRSLASNEPPVPTTTEDPASVTEDLSTATHLHFTHPTPLSLPLTTLTRFISSDIPVDLRSIFLAFLKKDVPIPEYIASAQQLNDALEKVEAGVKVLNLKFVERLDLITWLEGASEESEYIKPLEGVEKGAAVALGVEQTAQITAPAAAAAQAAAGARPTKPIDARLQEIYNGERRMGDRNSILRGIKPTDFSQVRKNAETFLYRSRAANNRPGQKPIPGKPGSTALSNSGPLASHVKPKSSIPSAPSAPTSSSNRVPIILLSPSASSLLRLSNIKSFLDSGIYIPPTHRLAGTDSSMLQISRHLPSLDTARPFRFILVDTTDNFKPDYWNRVVAVFTTGQTWQFKQYKWQDPGELFGHVLGVYVGWRGEGVPSSVKGWGRGVIVKEVDEWVEARDGRDDGKSRWRDREVVEGVWAAIEETMRRRGWGKEGPRG